MSYILRCMNCGKEYKKNEIEYTCPCCGDRKGTLEIILRKKKLGRDDFSFYSKKGIWQFIDLLPVETDSFFPPLEIGNTPLYKRDDIAQKFNIKEFYIKDDGKNPTASFKDRASALAVNKAYEKGYKTIFCASTGNAASSLSGLCAASNLKSVIFVPEAAPEAKLAQLQIYGARVIKINGSYDKAFDISLELGFKRNWYCRNSAINPYLLEGKKTCSLELAVQTSWKLPDVIFVSVGDGTVLSSFYKGFSDLKYFGLLDRIPKIIGVQAENASTLMKTYLNGEPFQCSDENVSTVADSIAVGKPRDVYKACKYTKKYGGSFISVKDSEIVDAIFELSRSTGVFAEPAGATAYAGFKKYFQREHSSKISAAVIVTGNGLKDLRTPLNHLKPLKVYNDIEEIKEDLDEN